MANQHPKAYNYQLLAWRSAAQRLRQHSFNPNALWQRASSVFDYSGTMSTSNYCRTYLAYYHAVVALNTLVAQALKP